MTSRERILIALEHREADCVPMWESFWPTTLKRWESEGLPAGTNPVAHFGLDATHMTAIDWTLQFQEEVREETEEHLIVRNVNGAMEKRLKALGSTPYWWDYRITDRASWEELKPRMVWNESRIDLARAKAAYEANRDLLQTYFPACLGFEKFKYAMGTEELLVAIASDPEWAKEMFDSTADVGIQGLEYLLAQGFEFDIAFVTEDMGFSNGPFFSPRTYTELIMPCQKRFCDLCHSKGIRVMLHTCGMNMPLIPLFIEAGFDILNPLEVKAGMDIFELKRNFGDVLTFWGGIDVRAIAHPDPAVLEKEIESKVTMAKQRGGYIFGSDHSIPDNVSLERYEYMLELGRKYGSYA